MYNFRQYYNYLGQSTSEYVIGVDRKLMDVAYARQRNTMWCWAAASQMAIGVAGLSVDQSVFTHDLCGTDQYGRINNCGANPYEINVYLNECGRDNYGEEYCVSSNLRLDPLTADEIINNLEDDYPIIAAYKEPNARFGHAVLITGAIITENDYTRIKTVEKLIVRDPANTLENRIKRGRYIVSAGEFVQKMYAWWAPYVTCMSCGDRLVA